MREQDSGSRIQDSGLQPGWHRWECLTCGAHGWVLVFIGMIDDPAARTAELHSVSSPRCPKVEIKIGERWNPA